MTCKNCLHVAVCARYSATGGMVKKCQHFATDIIVGRWIPITERLPEPFALVLTYDSTGKMVNDSYMTRHKEWVGVRMNHDVTHWMPIPELPKGEDNV